MLLTNHPLLQLRPEVVHAVMEIFTHSSDRNAGPFTNNLFNHIAINTKRRQYVRLLELIVLQAGLG